VPLQTGTKLAVKYLDDDLVLSATHAWTYVRLHPLAYEFQSYGAREGFVDQITLALATVVTSNQDPVECHLRVVHRPLDTLEWADQLDARVAKQQPTPGWGAYLAQMAQHVDYQMFDRKEVYLGVCLGVRSAKLDKTSLLSPMKLLSGMVEKAAGYEDLVVPDDELAKWRAKARDVHRALGASHLKARPATSAEVAWVIARPLWPEMFQPAPSVSPASMWGAGELHHLANGVLTHHRRYLEIEQDTPYGGVQTGYQATLAVSRFPDALHFPEQEPWMHFIARLGFPVDFSTRMSIVPAMQVQKDVGKKLADAKDQAIHIAESGTSVPLKVREQLEVATVLEYTIDKDRMPWAYARHRLTITGSTVEELTSRAKTVIEAYRELSMDVSWPSGDQLDLTLESMPGDRVRSGAYYQRQSLAVVSGGMPTASADVGDNPTAGSGWAGPYLGRTTSRVATPVFFSPHVSMARNFPPGVAITGAPGGGKSFLAFTLAHQMAMQGVWTIYIDPKADAKPMGQLPGLGNPRVFDLRDGNDGMLDPFSMGTNRGEATLLALETLRLLLGGQVSEEREEALLNAIEVVAQSSSPSLSQVVDVLMANTESAGARNLGSVLRTIRELPFARLCFAATGGTALRPEDGLTVVTLLGLDLPGAATKPEDYSYENRLAVSVMYLLTRYSRKLMLSMDKSHPKAICVDEAWAITSTPQGAKLIPEIARMGRSHNTALVLVSQNAGDLMAESVTNSISTKFAFRSSIPGEIDNVMELMGLAKDQNYQASVRDLRNGECLMQDVDGRVSRVYVDAWNQDLFDTFNTNPETRGKGSEGPRE
jgi:hypothetical protein